jgi:hypothetical protein
LKTILSIILIFVLSTSNLFAQSFIESINLKNSFVSFEELKVKVEKHSLSKRNYLSLGESHLYPLTSRPVLAELGKVFLHKNIFHKKLCSEKIGSFLNGKHGLELKRLVHQIEVYEDNSPVITDFKRCNDGNIELAVTYSGFFHQHPFARPFPNDFKATPVITLSKNNIRAQMKKLNGLFITLMEIDHIEMTTSNVILKRRFKDVKRFKEIIIKISHKITKLRRKMKTIKASTYPWRTKQGLILEQKHFLVKNVLPDNSFIILTDIKSRLNYQPLKLLNDIIKLSDKSLQGFLNSLFKERVFFTQSMIEPLADGSYSPAGYGTYNMSFPGGSSYLEMTHSKYKSVLITSSPQSKFLSCYTKKKGKVITLDCNTLF